MNQKEDCATLLAHFEEKRSVLNKHLINKVQ